MSQSDGFLAGCHQPLQQIVHGGVTGSACQDAFASGDCLANQLHDCRRFSRSRRPVNDRQITGGQAELHRRLLRTVQVRARLEMGIRPKGG